MRLRHGCMALLAALLLATAPLRAQTALVLSGGGARGLAHVGVLEVLEELGYEPALVVGTSMGAVVGALYAAGYSPQEIRARIMDVRWPDLFAPTPLIVGPERTVRWPAFTVGMDARRQRVQRGLFGAWRVNRTLTRLLFDATVQSRGDFDSLPRRFRAIAADLQTGAVVALDSGDVARAVRASMAVPGFFTPVEWDGRTLIDGGISDNLPVGVARRLGAQYIVASDVSRPTTEIPDLAPLTIIQRALDLMQENAQREAPPPDVLVLPDIDAGVSGMAFPDDPRPLIDIGAAAARRDAARAPPHSAAPLKAPAVATRALVGLTIVAPDSALAALARTAFAGVIGREYDAGAVLRAVDRLYTTGLVEAVWTRVLNEVPRDDTPALLIHLEAPPPLTLDAGAGFENDRGGRAWGALTRYAAIVNRPVLFSAAASTDGLQRDLTASAMHVLSGRPVYAWSIGAYASERNVRSFEEDAIFTQDVVRAGGWVGIEFPRVLRDRLTTAVLHAQWVDIEGGTHGRSIGPLLRFSGLNPETQIVGVPFLLEAERRWGEVPYTRVAARGSLARTAGALRLAAIADARGVSHGAPPDAWTALGDEHAMPGLRWGQERAAARLIAGIDAAYPVRTAFLRVRLRTGTAERTSGEAAAHERVKRLLDGRWMTGAQIGGSWRTPLGMLDVFYGFNSRRYGRFDLSIGRDF